MKPMIPPLSPYGTLTGDLFLYGQGRAAFESPSTTTQSSPKKCILIGGLSDGLMPTPYTSQLEQTCKDNGFSLVQPILSSSYTGFGSGTLDRDCSELQELMDYLQAHRSIEDCQFCLVGHSTGCQDIVHFLQNAPGDYRQKVTGFVLQASVSDREHAQVEEPETYAKNLALAREMRENDQLDECMPRSAFWAPITARRFLDLQEKGGTDDYFSSDYTDEEMIQRLGHCIVDSENDKVTRHGLIAFSGADEYVPKQVDCQELTDRLATAMNSKLPKEAEASSPRATSVCIPMANHNLSQPPSAVADFIKEVDKLLQRIK